MHKIKILCTEQIWKVRIILWKVHNLLLLLECPNRSLIHTKTTNLDWRGHNVLCKKCTISFVIRATKFGVGRSVIGSEAWRCVQDSVEMEQVFLS